MWALFTTIWMFVVSGSNFFRICIRDLFNGIWNPHLLCHFFSQWWFTTPAISERMLWTCGNDFAWIPSPHSHFACTCQFCNDKRFIILWHLLLCCSWYCSCFFSPIILAMESFNAPLCTTNHSALGVVAILWSDARCSCRVWHLKDSTDCDDMVGATFATAPASMPTFKLCPPTADAQVDNSPGDFIKFLLRPGSHWNWNQLRKQLTVWSCARNVREILLSVHPTWVLLDFSH